MADVGHGQPRVKEFPQQVRIEQDLVSPSPGADGDHFLGQDQRIHQHRELPTSAEGAHPSDEVSGDLVDFIPGCHLDLFFLQEMGKPLQVYLTITRT